MEFPSPSLSTGWDLNYFTVVSQSHAINLEKEAREKNTSPAVRLVAVVQAAVAGPIFSPTELSWQRG